MPDDPHVLEDQDIQEIIDEQFNQCTEEQRNVFLKYKVSLHKAPITRYGKRGKVFVVAQRGNEVRWRAGIGDERVDAVERA